MLMCNPNENTAKSLFVESVIELCNHVVTETEQYLAHALDGISAGPQPALERTLMKIWRFRSILDPQPTGPSCHENNGCREMV